MTVPQPRRVTESRPLLVTSLFDLHLHDRGSVGFPAEVSAPAAMQAALFESDHQSKVGPSANLGADIWNSLRTTWGLTGDLDGADAKYIVRRLFRFCLAISHSPQYEDDHADALREDWAHIPLPSSMELFNCVADLGEKIGLLLNPLSNPAPVIHELLGPARAGMAVLRRSGGGPVRGDDYLVAIPHYGAAQGGWRATTGETGNLYINQHVYFENVPKRVWAYELGGYPVLKKWLGYRDRGRRSGIPLSIEEVDHLRSIVHRVEALQRLHPELDRKYEEVCAHVFDWETVASTTGQ